MLLWVSKVTRVQCSSLAVGAEEQATVVTTNDTFNRAVELPLTWHGPELSCQFFRAGKAGTFEFELFSSCFRPSFFIYTEYCIQ
jgi:hypothetical protein